MDEHVDGLAQQILVDVGELGRNIRNAPQVAKRVAKQLLEVATDTEISHLHMHEQFRRQYASFEPDLPPFAHRWSHFAAVNDKTTTASTLLKDWVTLS
jgi:hypothetical protein